MRGWLFGFGFVVASQAFAKNAGHVVTPDFSVIRAKIDEVLKTTPPEKVLIAFDLDNTIMATDFDLGSEHWFLWQADMIQAKKFNEGAVAPTFADMLAVQTWILNLTQMHATEERISKDVAELGAKGVRSMVLTSRGLEMRDVTMRELNRNGFNFAHVAPGPTSGFPGNFLPYDLEHPERSGLTAAEVKALGLGKPAEVSFAHGVMLTQGQHKGAMLRTLLAKLGRPFEVIFFVDDRQHHSDGMQAAFAAQPEQVYTFRFSHETKRGEAFHASDKKEVKTQWCALSHALEQAFGFGKTGKAPLFIACPVTRAKQ